MCRYSHCNPNPSQRANVIPNISSRRVRTLGGERKGEVGEGAEVKGRAEKGCPVRRKDSKNPKCLE